MHGGVIEEALDRLSIGDVRAGACLPPEQPAQFRRGRHFAHTLDAFGEPGAVVSAGVAEIAVIDRQPVTGIGTGQPHGSPR